MMAYENKFVLAVLHDGHPVREINGKANIPFYSEYKIRLKNKHKDRRAKATVWVDGRKASNLGDIILEPGQTLDLERFLTDNLEEGRKFKFVPLSDSRVNDPTDENNGVIKVQFYPEQVATFRWDWDVKPLPSTPPISPNPAWPNWGDNTGGPTFVNDRFKGTGGRSTSSSITYRCFNSAAPIHDSNFLSDESAGATVEGGHSEQKFVWGESFPTETFPITLTLRLKPIQEARRSGIRGSPRRRRVGGDEDNKVRFCSSCGRRRSKMKDRFCPRCGNRY